MKLADTTIAVTGAGGFIGHAVCRRLMDEGARVRSLMRYRSDSAGEFQCDLALSVIDPAALQPPVRAVIHCAWDHKPYPLARAREINVDGSRWLLEQCKRAGVEQFVFLSSLAAHDHSHSVYGQTKREVEKLVLSRSDSPPLTTVIAAGTVIGSGGMFAQTRVALRKLPVLPVFSGSHDRCMQTIGIDELCDAIIESVAKRVQGRLVIADESGVGLTDFYKALATLDRRSPPSFPGGVAQFAAQKLTKIGFKSPASLANLLDAKDLKHCEVAESYRQLGLSLPLNYWQSLQKLAEKEGASDVAAQLAELNSRARDIK